jgi:hypothetical protein
MYEQEGFGTDQVWFSDAILYIPWEGAPSISPAELLSGVHDGLIPLVAIGEPAADCPATSRLNDRARRNRVSQISGRGHMGANATFVVDCLCAIEQIKELSPEQASRLYAGPLPRQ